MEVRGISALFPFKGYVIQKLVFSEEIVRVNLRFDKRRRIACPDCNATMAVYREESQSARDLPFGPAKHVIITYPSFLARCPTCRSTHTIHPPGIPRHAKATDRFMRYTSLLARHLPLKRVAEILEISESSARRYDKRILEEDLPPIDLDGVQVLLVDEKHLGPSMGYVTLVMDGDRGDLLFLAPGKKKDSLQEFFDLMDDAQKSAVSCVCIDRAGHYKDVVELNCPNAEIVYDKFHVKKNLNDIVDEVRRTEWRDAAKEDQRAIKGQRYNLLRAADNNSPEQERSLWDLLRLNENLHTAYVLKESFDNVWSYSYRKCAERYLGQWAEWARESAIDPMVRFAKTIWENKDHITAYVNWPVTTSRLECLNGMVERIVRRACGMKDLLYLYLKIRQESLYCFGLQT